MSALRDQAFAPRAPEFVSQAMFRTAVLLAELQGRDPSIYFPGPIMVHPDALRWYQAREGQWKMNAHFGMLDGDE